MTTSALEDNTEVFEDPPSRWQIETIQKERASI
jgi:hypothetical protein